MVTAGSTYRPRARGAKGNMGSHLKPRHSEQGFRVLKSCKKECHQLLVVSWRSLRRLGLGAERKWRLEPTAAAAGVVLAGKKTPELRPFFLLPAFQPSLSTSPCWNLTGSQLVPGSGVCRVLAPAMEQNTEGWIQAERHSVNNLHSISLCENRFFPFLSIVILKSAHILPHTFSLELVSGSRIRESKKMHIFKALHSG